MSTADPTDPDEVLDEPFEGDGRDEDEGTDDERVPDAGDLVMPPPSPSPSSDSDAPAP